MSRLLTFLAMILTIVYIVSPYDFAPDFMPIIGWLDDMAILALAFFYLRNGKLPDFLTRMMRGRMNTGTSSSRGRESSGYRPSDADAGRTSSQFDPYAVLGVKPGASKDEIHAAYRRLVHQYHPDKVSHLGKEFQEMAGKKFVEIQDAYEALTGRRS